MELSWALSNPRVQVELPQLGVLCRLLMARETQPTGHTRLVGSRQGEIKDTIMRVLNAADEPTSTDDNRHERAEGLHAAAVRESMLHRVC